MKHRPIFILIACVSVLSGCALQRDLYVLDNRLAALERRYSESEQEHERFKTRVVKSQSATLHEELEKIREEIQALNGRLDETNYLVKHKAEVLKDSDNKLENRLDALYEKIRLTNKRIIYLEQYLNLEPLSDLKEGLDTAPEKEPSESKLSESKLYAQAKRAFDEGDFETARDRFREFLNKFSKSAQADNAQFWIGDSYYHEKWYEKAILEYQKVIENYPKGNKIRSALLKQGLAFFNLQDKANARIILEELIKKYPQSNQAKIAIEKLKGF